MSGDGTSDIEIPAVFMQKHDATYLQELMKTEDNIFILLTGLPDRDEDEDEDVRGDGVRGVESEGETEVEDSNHKNPKTDPSTGYQTVKENSNTLESDSTELDSNSRTDDSEDRTAGN